MVPPNNFYPSLFSSNLWSNETLTKQYLKDYKWEWLNVYFNLMLHIIQAFHSEWSFHTSFAAKASKLGLERRYLSNYKSNNIHWNQFTIQLDWIPDILLVLRSFQRVKQWMMHPSIEAVELNVFICFAQYYSHLVG